LVFPLSLAGYNKKNMVYPLLNENGLCMAGPGGPAYCEDLHDVHHRWRILVDRFGDAGFDINRLTAGLGDRDNGFYFLEELMAFPRNYGVEKARRWGLRLLEQRFCQEMLQLEKRYPLDRNYKGKAAASLANSYRQYYKARKRAMRHYIRLSYGDATLLTEPDGRLYLGVVKECLNAIHNLGDDLVRLRVRLNEVKNTTIPHRGKTVTATEQVTSLDERFITANLRSHEGFTLHEVNDERSRDFWEAYCLLARDFGTDVMYSPKVIREVTRECRVRKGALNTLHGESDKQIWNWWITAVIKDPDGKIVCAGDGSLISDGWSGIFYASHIAVKDEYRSHNLGTFLSAGILQIAQNKLEKHLPAALAGNSPDARRLTAEVGEIEFPDHFLLDPDSHKRLVFHGRLNRSVMWPVLYAQPDTDYRDDEFNVEKWNSVPMFICYRPFGQRNGGVESVAGAVGLLFDFYSVLSSGGAEHDRTYMISGFDTGVEPQMIRLPADEDGLAGFLDSIGMRRELLEQYYPGHHYTRTRTN
jgi:hypothetical protein